MNESLTSWGRVHRYNHSVLRPQYLGQIDFDPSKTDKRFTTLYGQGRSYGDVALNEGQNVINTSNLQRIQHLDWDTGVIRAESGVTLDQILHLSVPKGWFLPVTPGSKFVSLGGAVANDVHGKNHHHAGSIGAHIRALGLYRSDGERLILSPEHNTELYNLTISGLGLTGMIEWVELQLISVRSSQIYVENQPYNHLDEFYELSADSKHWPYVVSWVDCFASGKNLGRGIFMRGRHVDAPGSLKAHVRSGGLTWPFVMPPWVLNKQSISVFNTLYRHRPGANAKGTVHYDRFFYPLDRIQHWNRLYGKYGFFQHQCIIPIDTAPKAMHELLSLIHQSGQGSFLAVLKNHGQEQSPGKNSFCLEGTSLALDFANRGQRTRDLLAALDEVVYSHSGRLYPAKDGFMSSKVYQAGYPNWKELEAFRDPALNSAFWQRVTKQ